MADAPAFEALGIWAVFDHVSPSLAVVAGHFVTVIHTPILIAVASDVSHLAALITAVLILLAVPGNVASLVAPVATFLLLGTVPGDVTKPVALVTTIPIIIVITALPSEMTKLVTLVATALPISSISSTSSTSSPVISISISAVPGKMPKPLTLEASIPTIPVSTWTPVPESITATVTVIIVGTLSGEVTRLVALVAHAGGVFVVRTFPGKVAGLVTTVADRCGHGAALTNTRWKHES